MFSLKIALLIASLISPDTANSAPLPKTTRVTKRTALGDTSALIISQNFATIYNAKHDGTIDQYQAGNKTGSLSVQDPHARQLLGMDDLYLHKLEKVCFTSDSDRLIAIERVANPLNTDHFIFYSHLLAISAAGEVTYLSALNSNFDVTLNCNFYEMKPQNNILIEGLQNGFYRDNEERRGISLDTGKVVFQGDAGTFGLKIFNLFGETITSDGQWIVAYQSNSPDAEITGRIVLASMNFNNPNQVVQMDLERGLPLSFDPRYPQQLLVSIHGGVTVEVQNQTVHAHIPEASFRQSQVAGTPYGRDGLAAFDLVYRFPDLKLLSLKEVPYDSAWNAERPYSTVLMDFLTRCFPDGSGLAFYQTLHQVWAAGATGSRLEDYVPPASYAVSSASCDLLLGVNGEVSFAHVSDLKIDPTNRYLKFETPNDLEVFAPLKNSVIALFHTWYSYYDVSSRIWGNRIPYTGELAAFIQKVNAYRSAVLDVSTDGKLVATQISPEFPLAPVFSLLDGKRLTLKNYVQDLRVERTGFTRHAGSDYYYENVLLNYAPENQWRIDSLESTPLHGENTKIDVSPVDPNHMLTLKQQNSYGIFSLIDISTSQALWRASFNTLSFSIFASQHPLVVLRGRNPSGYDNHTAQFLDLETGKVLATFSNTLAQNFTFHPETDTFYFAMKDPQGLSNITAYTYDGQTLKSKIVSSGVQGLSFLMVSSDDARAAIVRSVNSATNSCKVDFVDLNTQVILKTMTIGQSCLTPSGTPMDVTEMGGQAAKTWALEILSDGYGYAAGWLVDYRNLDFSILQNQTLNSQDSLPSIGFHHYLDSGSLYWQSNESHEAGFFITE